MAFFARPNWKKPALHKVPGTNRLQRRNLDELEKMLIEAGVGTAEQIRAGGERRTGLGLFLSFLGWIGTAACCKRRSHKCLENRQLKRSGN